MFRSVGAGGCFSFNFSTISVKSSAISSLDASSLIAPRTSPSDNLAATLLWRTSPTFPDDLGRFRL